MQPFSLFRYPLSPLLAVLLLQLFLRTHQIQKLDAFVDEGYHLTRAAVVWDFDTHPARSANGKLLLYFWLGLFETAPQSALPIGRLSIALFSLLNGALLYRLGCKIHSPAVGLLAAALYAVLPFAFFYERMALADPFASVFVGAAAWQSLRLVKRPSLRGGAWLGFWLGCATLAKLTMGLIPLLPVAAALIFYPWSAHTRQDITTGLKLYFRPLCVATGVVILMWLPILIPAALAINSDAPFTVVNAENLQDVSRAEPLQDLQELAPALLTYLSGGFAALVIFLGLFLLSSRRWLLFLLVWGGLIFALPLIAASEIRLRYLMPLASPLVLLVAYGIVILGQKQRWLGGILLGGLGLWSLLFALPFAYDLMNYPSAAPLSESDQIRYMSGNFSGEALRQAAQEVNQLGVDKVYSTWGTCQLLYFYVEQTVTCLPAPSPQHDLRTILTDYLADDLAAGRQVVVVLNGYGAETLHGDETTWELVQSFPRQNIDRPMFIWKIEITPTHSTG